MTHFVVPGARRGLLGGCLIPCLGLMTLAGAAYAQEASESPVVLGTVVLQTEDSATDGYEPVVSSTATLRPKPILDIPQAVNVVSEEVLRDQATHTLDEALANISGIAQTNTLGGTQDAIIRRGFGSNRDGSILTDGLKTVLPRSFNITTERVEVLKGPASTLYGILDPGGMVNVITKKPKFTSAGEMHSSLSSFGGGSVSVDVTGPIKGRDDLAYRFVAEYSDVDYWRNFGKNRSWTLNPSLSWRNDTTSVTISYLHQKYDVPFDRGTIYDLDNGRFVDVDPETRFDEPFNITDGKTDRLALEATHDFGAGWTAKLGYSYSRYNYSDNQARVISYDSATGDVRRRVDATQDATAYAHALRIDVSGDVMLGGMRNELLFGASYDYEDTLRTDMMRCASVWDFNVHDPIYGSVGKCTEVSPDDSDQTEQLHTGSLYAQNNLHVNDRWIVTAGLRYQNYDLMAGKGRPFNTNTDSNGDVWLPNAGVVFKYSPTTTFYANAGKTFRPQSSIASSYGNLPPEKGVSYELGAKFELANGILLNAALYDSEKKNVAYSELVGDETVVKTAGKVRARGFEMDLAGQLTDRLSIIASYGYTDAKITDDPDYQGMRPVNIPRHTGSLFLAYDFGVINANGNSLRIGGGVKGMSSREATNANEYDLPGYAVADVFVAYTIAAERPVVLQMNLKNIFDKTYYTSSIGSTAYANSIGEPFNAELSASLRF